MSKDIYNARRERQAEERKRSYVLKKGKTMHEQKPKTDLKIPAAPKDDW
jgi:hypothetical protein